MDGPFDGVLDGVVDGNNDGDEVDAVGVIDGSPIVYGAGDGLGVGESDGEPLGMSDGDLLGEFEGDGVGLFVGFNVGQQASKGVKLAEPDVTDWPLSQLMTVFQYVGSP